MADHENKKNDILELAPEVTLPEPEQGSFWGKLKRGLLMTHTEILDKVSSAMEGKAEIDERTLEYLEEALIGADLGVSTALEMIERVRKNATKDQVKDVQRVRKMLVDEMSGMLMEMPRARPLGKGPLLTLVVGVNGVGKTTSIAKLARLAQLNRQKVVIAAADTFRAAAIEQLELWGKRLGVDVIRQVAGADPAAVVYDGIQA